MNKIPEKYLEQFIATFADGCKPAGAWKLGFEFERIGVMREGLRPLPFSGSSPSIQTLFDVLVRHGGWEPVVVDGERIELRRDGAATTLEPGCQIELSTKQHNSVAVVVDQVLTWLRELQAASTEGCGSAPDPEIYWLATGLNPFHQPGEANWVPKKRYALMRERFKKTGSLGAHMMSLTAALQVSIDYADEVDCSHKLKAAMRLSPIITAMFANSPIMGGRPSGFVSTRAHIWTQTDSSRAGLPDFAFSARDTVWQEYLSYALQAPMLFRYDVQREALERVDPVESFRAWIERPEVSDTEVRANWPFHLSSLFPEVRLKNFLEIRCADANGLPLSFSLPALCCGLFYDLAALEEVLALVQRFTQREAIEAMRSSAARGLSQARYGRYRTIDLAQEVVEIARQALQASDMRLQYRDAPYLEPLLEQVLERRCSPGEEQFKAWGGNLNSDVTRLAAYLAEESVP